MRSSRRTSARPNACAPCIPGGQFESPLPPRPSVPTENLLDQMDIYALSPHAAALSLPRMVSPQLVLRAHAGKGTLPPPAVWRELVAKASGRYGLDPERERILLEDTDAHMGEEADPGTAARGMDRRYRLAARLLGNIG